MSDDAQFTETQHAALKDILVGWGDLSRGDISIICANWRQPGQIETVGGTPHARFWQNLVQVGWAERLYSMIDPETVPFEPLSFRLTDEGHMYLPRFLLFYDLLNMGACTPAVDKETLLAKQRRRISSENEQEWLPNPRRLIVVSIFIAAALWLAYRGGNPLLCFFLITYSAVVALLMNPAIFKARFDKFFHCVAGLNALFLACSTFPLLFH